MNGRCSHPSFRTPVGSLRLVLVLAAALLLRPVVAVAGGGPENLFLVVNSNDASSLTIANHFIHLRDVPVQNVLYLPWNAKQQLIDVDTFRRQILGPVLKTIEVRGLASQIDCVAYSSGYPHAVDLKADVQRYLDSLKKEEKERKRKEEAEGKEHVGESGAAKTNEWPEALTPVGSINGLTYLWQGVMSGQPGYMDLECNRYARRALPHEDKVSTMGFRGSYEFGPEGELVASGGHRYFLSIMLGVTDGRGNTLEEVLRYLDRSKTADGTHPPGTIYFVKNADIRSRVRDGLFPAAVRLLKQSGIAGEILEGIAPENKSDVQGVMMGTATFEWKTTGSTILPGAICDHFTSLGGALSKGAVQTPLTMFLRYGAAGASGTVTEPYAIPVKFPNAMLQVHYARGCTLAEAFYQSVLGPYQLLIVGDPLCRPWANIPEVTLQGVEPGSTVKDKIVLTPSASVRGGASVDGFELFVDGRRVDACEQGGRLEFDTRRIPDGYHELRVVALEAGPICSQGRKILSVFSANYGGQIAASVTPKQIVAQNQSIVVTANSPGAIGIAVLSNAKTLGIIPGSTGKLEILPAALGIGPVQLQAIALGSKGPSTNVIAEPVTLVIQPMPKAGESGQQSAVSNQP